MPLLPRLLVALAVALVRLYQLLLSPLLHALTGSGCRFHPSCSEYAVAVLRKDGLRLGGARALRRLGRCHPFSSGGVDLPQPAPHRSPWLLSVVNGLPLLAGFCYTQFADTYQETNGLLFADRRPKIPLAQMASLTRGVAPEEQ